MTTKRKSYKGLVIVLTFILIALFIYVNRDQKDDNTGLLKEKEFQNRKLLDSLNKVGGELVRVIDEQKRREAESFDKFKRETERLKKEYDEKLRNLSNLTDDEHVRLLSEELSKED
jgi:hypothetical protein